MKKLYILTFFAFLLFGCSEGLNDQVSDWSESPFAITSESQLIGGPVAIGQIGDQLLENDRIKVIIQKPTKNSDLGSFGGTIIDADIQRSGSGNDNFGEFFPMINAEWTVNYQRFEALSEKGKKILRAHGVIDVYDYLDLDFVGDVAEGAIGQKLYFSNKFDDRKNPFSVYNDLKGINPNVITDYILENGKNYVRVETTLKNDGNSEVEIPVGLIINGSGQLSYLVPGQGYSPDIMMEVAGPTSAVLFDGHKGVDVSYGIFWDPSQFINPKTSQHYTSTSVSFSSVNFVFLGEEVLKLLPLSEASIPEVHFKISPNSERKIVTYFVVGNGDSGSVMDSGIDALKMNFKQISGRVVNENEEAVKDAQVAILNSKGKTVVSYKTNSDGRFSGNLPFGSGPVEKLFYDGTYKAVVEVEGYHKNGTYSAGSCTPEELDLTKVVSINCVLGETSKIIFSNPPIDEETGETTPARLTIVGEDPSPNESAGGGLFRDTSIFARPFGIYGVKYITKRGTVDLTDKNYFNLEPGKYLFVFSRGPEYQTDERIVVVEAGAEININDIIIRRAYSTPNFIGADFHLHSIISPDSALPRDMRILTATGEGLDLLQSTDHDALTDYSNYYNQLVSKGIVSSGSIKTSVGQEITPNHYGHIQAFPLTFDSKDPDGGAVDWSDSAKEIIGFDPDYVFSVDEFIDLAKKHSGEQVIQINHIMDNPTGLILATGLVTSTAYIDKGVMPMSSFADPVERRMDPALSSEYPLPYGHSGLVTKNATAIELFIGFNFPNQDILFRSSLPTWFNFLNLGYIMTATASSDSHTITSNPIGLPRNFVYSGADPRDGIGTNHESINLDSYAKAINEHRVIISAGPFVEITATNEIGQTASVGETITGKQQQIRVKVTSPSWAWFDTIEIYTNTIPLPVDDESGLPFEGTASDPAIFYMPYHQPRYSYEPFKRFDLSSGTLESWEENDGIITAMVSMPISATEDTWVVALAKGTRTTEGYRSLFPVVPDVLKDKKQKPEFLDVDDLYSIHEDNNVHASAFGMTNPIFIDVDNNGFTAIHSEFFPK